MLPRLALAFGGLVALLLTPAFALSYFLSYGEPDESPPGWLAQLREPLLDAGLLNAGSTETYGMYGRLYFAAWVLGVAGLAGLLRQQWPQFTRPVRWAWVALVIALGVVALGILGEYASRNDSVNEVGFGLTVLGFLGTVAACGLLAWALRRDRSINAWTAVGVGALGVVSTGGGFALVGHIPSGLGLGFAAAGLFLGLAGLSTQESPAKD